MTAELMTKVEEKQEIGPLFEGLEVTAEAAAPEEAITTAETHNPQSQLFTVRMWPEPVGDGQQEWRGKVEHVTSGKSYYIRDWSKLPLYLRMMLQKDASKVRSVG